MKTITVQKFQATDGAIFDTKESCIQYEARLILKNIQNTCKNDLFIYCQDDYDDIVDYLITNKEYIQEFYKRLDKLEKE